MDQKPRSLTAKQELFVAEYLVDLNATQAAIRAGYSKKTAYSIGDENLRKPEIAEAIQAAMNDRVERTEISADYVLQSIVSAMERCKQAEPVTDRTGQPTGEFTFNASGVLKGAELLGRHLKLFTDKVEHSGTVTHDHRAAAEREVAELFGPTPHLIERVHG